MVATAAARIADAARAFLLRVVACVRLAYRLDASLRPL